MVEHGRSETIIGRWMADRGNRDQVVVATKVGGGKGAVRNLRAETIEREAEASLDRLQTDHIDLYFAHFDDQDTPLEETLPAFDALVRAGTVRHIAASNYSASASTAALEFQREHGLAEFTVLQPHYNLVEREFERTMLPVADAWDLAVIPYFALAQGFLTGKYRPGGEAVESSAPRARGVPRQRRRGRARSARRGRRRPPDPVAAVALAWLLAHPVVAPIASARTTEQLDQILPAATLELTPRSSTGCPANHAVASAGMTPRTVLITGCSTGIGRSCAERLARAGHTVYATARRLESIEDLQGGGVPHARARRHRRGIDERPPSRPSRPSGAPSARSSTTPATRSRARSRRSRWRTSAVSSRPTCSASCACASSCCPGCARGAPAGS